MAVSSEPPCVTRTRGCESYDMSAMCCNYHSKPNVARILTKCKVSRNILWVIYYSLFSDILMTLGWFMGSKYSLSVLSEVDFIDSVYGIKPSCEARCGLRF
jgi:hypothetical protein